MAGDHTRSDSDSESQAARVESDRLHAGRRWLIGAWFAWVLLHAAVSYLILHSGGPGRGVVELALYSFLTAILCLWTVVVFAFHRKNLPSYLITVCLLLLGPVLSAHYLGAKKKQVISKAHAAAEEVKRLCVERGGDKIYRTVEDVEGVFQLIPMPRFHKNLDNQFGRAYPWHRQMGERSRMSRFIAPGANGYLFVEHLTKLDQDTPPYLRTILKDTGKSVRNQKPDRLNPQRPTLSSSTIEVDQLRSRYGWLSDDLTTVAMREKWIGGGRIKVIDLQTGEVLAERTGFFLAKGRGRYPWHGEDVVLAGCPGSSTTTMFIKSVLVPVKNYPSEEKLKSLRE